MYIYMHFHQKNESTESEEMLKESEAEYIVNEENPSQPHNPYISDPTKTSPDRGEQHESHYVSLGKVGKEDFLSFGFQIADGMVRLVFK